MLSPDLDKALTGLVTAVTSLVTAVTSLLNLAGKEAGKDKPERTLGEALTTGAKKAETATASVAGKPASTTKPATAAKPTPAAKPAAKPATDDAYAPVGAAITAAVAAGHKNGVKNILAEYDVAKGSELDPSTYADVLEKLAIITNGEVDDLA